MLCYSITLFCDRFLKTKFSALQKDFPLIIFKGKPWLAFLFDLREVVLAMKTAYDKMFGLRDYNKFSFRVEIREQGGFIMDCPGDATGLHPTDWYMRDDEGYRFSCHNVDTTLQQLTLLAGLAVIHDKARQGK